MFYKLQKGNITSIYNTRIRGYKSDNVCLIHKIQNVSGTVDEKLPYLVHSLKNNTAEIKVLVLDGIGWRESALDWVEQALIFEKIKLFYSVKEANNFLQEVYNDTTD